MPLLLIEGKMMTLRIMTVIRYGLLLLSATFAQSEERDADAYSIRLVKEAVKNPGFALGLSFTEKEINRLGDRVSIALLKIYDVDGLRSPHNIKNYLRIVRAAFVAPRIVQIVEDRKPQVTMFVLTYLEREVGDAQSKAEIVEAIKYIRGQTSEE